MKIFLTVIMIISISFTTFGQNSITLISLTNKDTIDHKHPVFNWYYSNIPTDRSDVKYNFVLVKLNPNQSATSGVAVNQPLLRINDVQGFQLVYPYSAPELEYGNSYGWQLEKTINNIIIEKSEAWEFTLYKKVKIPTKYALLSTSYSSTVYKVTAKGFFFKLDCRYKQTKPLNITVLDKYMNKVNVQLEQDKKTGFKKEDLVNTAKLYYYLNTTSYKPGIYRLKVKDIKGNIYTTKFKVQ